MQVLISLIILGAFVGGLIFKFIKDQASRLDIETEEVLNHEMIVSKVVQQLADLMKSDQFTGKDDRDYEAFLNRRRTLESAMTNCVFGIDKDKIIVKEMIRSFLTQMLPTAESIENIYHLNSPGLDPWVMFEVLMERLSPIHRKDSLPYLIGKYGWDQTRYNIEDGTIPSYNVSIDDLQQAFDQEMVEPLNYTEMLKIVSTIVYSEYKGMGVIDTLRTQNIDGFNIGTSGAIMQTGDDIPWKANRSVWVYYQGKYIHFQFLAFKDENEVRRVVQLLARYNNPGPLTEKRGYVITTMYDKSRVLALRPNASEYWACFVRKFVLSSHALEALIDPVKKDPVTGAAARDKDGQIIHKYKNAFLPMQMVKLLMWGQVTTGFTGRQGSGKTTMMVAAISQVDARFNIRVLETAPEMYLREIYSQRNILSVAETPTVSAMQLQDALKKSDAALSIVGEVATDIIAARMIQMGQVASIYTIFSHHANRTKDLVNAITNSIVSASGGSATPATVEPQVIDVIKVDAHLDYDVMGNRYIERFTEIIRLDAKPYPLQKPNESNEDYKIRLDREYYTRVTDRETFTTRDVLVFDPHTFTYDVAREPNGRPVFFSPELTKHIFSRLPRDVVNKWKKFVNDYWFDDKLGDPNAPYIKEDRKKKAEERQKRMAEEAKKRGW